MNIKKIRLLVLAGIVVIGLLYLGYTYLRDLLFKQALAQAKADYELKIGELEAKIKVNTDFYVALIGDSEKKRQDELEAHRKEKAKFEGDKSYFKSETAKALKEKNATVEQWEAEKVKDEITINLQAERINELDLKYDNLVEAWKQSDIKKDAAHEKIVSDLKLQFVACQEWSKKLENKLKPKPIAKIIQLAEIGAAFALGTLL